MINPTPARGQQLLQGSPRHGGKHGVGCLHAAIGTDDRKPFPGGLEHALEQFHLLAQVMLRGTVFQHHQQQLTLMPVMAWPHPGSGMERGLLFGPAPMQLAKTQRLCQTLGSLQPLDRLTNLATLPGIDQTVPEHVLRMGLALGPLRPLKQGPCCRIGPPYTPIAANHHHGLDGKLKGILEIGRFGSALQETQQSHGISSTPVYPVASDSIYVQKIQVRLYPARSCLDHIAKIMIPGHQVNRTNTTSNHNASSARPRQSSKGDSGVPWGNRLYPVSMGLIRFSPLIQ